eukprot:87396-Pelagomonas_calceolata.AAC.1
MDHVSHGLRYPDGSYPMKCQVQHTKLWVMHSPASKCDGSCTCLHRYGPWVQHNSAPTYKSASASDSDTMAQQQHH